MITIYKTRGYSSGNAKDVNILIEDENNSVLNDINLVLTPFSGTMRDRMKCAKIIKSLLEKYFSELDK